MATPNYGFTNSPQPGAPPPQQQGNGMAVAGLVLGILGAVLFFVPFIGWILAILGIIFGAVGNSKANKIGGKGKGMAIAGLVLGLIGLVVGVGLFVKAYMDAKAYIESGGYRGDIAPIVQKYDRA
jgi:hypothetical protein